MKQILIAALLICSVPCMAQTRRDSCRYNCKSVSLWELKNSDNFFFPASSRLDLNEALPDYQFQTGKLKKVETPEQGKRAILEVTKSRTARYPDIRGKIYTVTGVESVPAVAYKDSAYQYLTIKLLGPDSLTQLVFTKVFNRTEADADAKAHPDKNNLTLPGAVYLPELTLARQQLAALEDVYILESPIDKAKFEPVTIVGVDTGTAETPVRIQYRVNTDTSRKVHFKDVSFCGNNIMGAFRKTFQFSVFFTCYTNPVKADPAHWELIRKGKISKGMRLKDVEFAIGKSQKLRSGIEAGDKKTVYQSGDYKLTFENEILKEIK